MTTFSRFKKALTPRSLAKREGLNNKTLQQPPDYKNGINVLSVVVIMIALSFFNLPSVNAQVPNILSYQGRIAVSGVNFEGAGLFKFAFVDAEGNTTYWSNDGTSAAGSQPTAAVTLAVKKGLYSVLLGDTGMTNMTGIPVNVWMNSDIRLRVWFSDAVNGFQLLSPDQRIAPSGYIPTGVVTADAIALGAVGTTQLATGAVKNVNIAAGAVESTHMASGSAAQNLAASGMAGVPSGGLLISATENPALVAAGYIKIGTAQLSNGAPSHRYDHTALWTGSEMIVWGGYSESCEGGLYNLSTNTWRLTTLSNAPEANRVRFYTVGTNTEMIVWGGLGMREGSSSNNNPYLNTGSRYNWGQDKWTPLTQVGAPVCPVNGGASVAAGYMVIWGGYTGIFSYLGGSRYDIATDTWSQVSSTNQPSSRYKFRPISTGTEIIIWGGAYFASPTTTYLATGARYNPLTNIWTTMSTSAAPVGRTGFSAVWTGNEMIIFGGSNGALLADGARYNLTNNSWTSISTVGAPSPRSEAVAVWTGTEMIIWGGRNTSNDPALGSGGCYNPTQNTWRTISNIGAPSGRDSCSAVWTGSEMIIWGGFYNPAVTMSSKGYAYNPSTDTWRELSDKKTYILYQKP